MVEIGGWKREEKDCGWRKSVDNLKKQLKPALSHKGRADMCSIHANGACVVGPSMEDHRILWALDTCFTQANHFVSLTPPSGMRHRKNHVISECISVSQMRRL